MRWSTWLRSVRLLRFALAHTGDPALRLRLARVLDLELMPRDVPVDVLPMLMDGAYPMPTVPP